jgi:hypothetical protein
VVYDSQRRPITAGGFVDSGPTVFQDVTERAGLGAWRHVMGTPEKKYILEADGSGVGLIDCDNDGYISANDQRLHFGLGDSTTVETVEIRWPDGTRETIKLPGVDRIFSIEQGKGALAEIGGNIPVDKTAKRVRPEPDTHRK